MQESMRGSEFVFDYVHLLYYKCHQNNSALWWIIYRLSCLDKNKKQ